MIVDALVLAGGRGSRLGGVVKAALTIEGVTLLERTLHSLTGVRRVVVLGDERELPTAAVSSAANVSVTREHPALGGPVAAVAAGLTALDAGPGPDADAVLLLAVDMPHVAELVPLLLAATAAHPRAEAVLALDDEERAQPLAGVYRVPALRRAVAELAATQAGPHPLEGQPLHALTARMLMETVRAAGLLTADVDTPADAAQLGVLLTAGASPAPVPRSTGTTTSTATEGDRTP